LTTKHAGAIMNQVHSRVPRVDPNKTTNLASLTYETNYLSNISSNIILKKRESELKKTKLILDPQMRRKQLNTLNRQEKNIEEIMQKVNELNTDSIKHEKLDSQQPLFMNFNNKKIYTAKIITERNVPPCQLTFGYKQTFGKIGIYYSFKQKLPKKGDCDKEIHGRPITM
jgi:hypothetical protein